MQEWVRASVFGTVLHHMPRTEHKGSLIGFSVTSGKALLRQAKQKQTEVGNLKGAKFKQGNLIAADRKIWNNFQIDDQGSIKTR